MGSSRSTYVLDDDILHGDADAVLVLFCGAGRGRRHLSVVKLSSLLLLSRTKLVDLHLLNFLRTLFAGSRLQRVCVGLGKGLEVGWHSEWLLARTVDSLTVLASVIHLCLSPH